MTDTSRDSSEPPRMLGMQGVGRPRGDQRMPRTSRVRGSHTERYQEVAVTCTYHANMSIYCLYPTVLSWNHKLGLHQLLDRQNDAILYAQTNRCTTLLRLMTSIFEACHHICSQRTQNSRLLWPRTPPMDTIYAISSRS